MSRVCYAFQRGLWISIHYELVEIFNAKTKYPQIRNANFILGECNRGDECRFAHAAGGEAPSGFSSYNRAPREGSSVHFHKFLVDLNVHISYVFSVTRTN